MVQHGTPLLSDFKGRGYGLFIPPVLTFSLSVLSSPSLILYFPSFTLPLHLFVLLPVFLSSLLLFPSFYPHFCSFFPVPSYYPPPPPPPLRTLSFSPFLSFLSTLLFPPLTHPQLVPKIPSGNTKRYAGFKYVRAYPSTSCSVLASWSCVCTGVLCRWITCLHIILIPPDFTHCTSVLCRWITYLAFIHCAGVLCR